MNHKPVHRLAFVTLAAVVFAASAPVHASEVDNRIEKSFKQSYVYKTYLKEDSIKAKSEEGIVTLTGTVVEKSHKTLAEDTIAGMPGVVRVDNQITTKVEEEEASADYWIGYKVKHTLLFHRHVSGNQTDVSVKDGVVTLKGEAASQAQKELTAKYAADIEGVVSVKNEMTVAAKAKQEKQTMGEKIDDASVTAQVKMALLTHRSTSAIKTKVETQDGAVTLTGIADNEAEKTLVTELTNDIKGVVSVKNIMTVKTDETK